MFGKIGLAETDQRTYKGVTLFGGVQFYDLFGDANVFVIVGPILMLLDVDPDFIFHACTSRFRFVGLDPFNLMQSGQSHMPKKNTLESDGWMQLLSIAHLPIYLASADTNVFRPAHVGRASSGRFIAVPVRLTSDA